MRVVVLMSTFNGERFVEDQVQSILDQLPANGRLMVRDDGSNDKTVALIDAFNDPRVQISIGENIGFGRSFLTLLCSVPADAQMVMFSDQDDVWLPEKIHRAWEKLQPYIVQPALYGSTQILVDESLNRLHVTDPWPRKPSFNNAIAENIITGCTAAINYPALQLLQRAGAPLGVHFHDWWLYLVVSAFGVVLVDRQPTLLYRQHNSNLIGHGAGWWRRQYKMYKFLVKHDWMGMLLSQIATFNQYYGSQLSHSQNQQIKKNFRIGNASAQPRLSIVFSPILWRQKLLHEFIFRIFILKRIISK